MNFCVCVCVCVFFFSLHFFLLSAGSFKFGFFFGCQPLTCPFVTIATSYRHHIKTNDQIAQWPHLKWLSGARARLMNPPMVTNKPNGLTKLS